MWDNFLPVEGSVDTSLRFQPLPRPGMKTRERRRRRAENPARALELALTAAAGRGALDAVLLADDFGMIVSKSDTGLDLEDVAAVTPIVGRGRGAASIRRGGEPRSLGVRTVSLGDELLYLAAVGGTDEARNRELDAVAKAASRILA